jgi:hypothetical protein
MVRLALLAMTADWFAIDLPSVFFDAVFPNYWTFTTK